MISNGYYVRRNEENRTIEVRNVSGVKLVTDGPGAKRRAIDWTRNRVAGSMTPDEAAKVEQIEAAYEEAAMIERLENDGIHTGQEG